MAYPVDPVSICCNNTECQTDSECKEKYDQKICPEYLEPLLEKLNSDLSSNSFKHFLQKRLPLAIF